MKKNTIALILNGLVSLMALGSFAYLMIYGLNGNMDGSGTRALVYFTVQSNILIGLVSLISFYYLCKNIKTPVFFRYLKFASVAAITTTMLVACFFLSLFFGFWDIIAGLNFFMHLLTPLFALISFLFFENEEPFDKKAIVIGMLPVILYGIVYYFQVVEYQNWSDFYRFNQGGKWYITIAVMAVFEFALCALIRKITNKSMK